MNPHDASPPTLETTIEAALGPLNEVERKNAPAQIFVAGNLEILRSGRRVSVVGSRRADDQTLDSARAFAAGLARLGIVVVSGLAEGVDTAAHQGAIHAGGSTIAVLGTPLNEFFPAKNRALQQNIMRQHLAVSQFAPGAPSQRGNFPRRNRTMALLSDATVIVAAGEKSGSLHQGWEALRLGRPLFLFANLLRDPAPGWAAELQRYGALPLDPTDLESLLDELPERSRGEAAELAL